MQKNGERSCGASAAFLPITQPTRSRSYSCTIAIASERIASDAGSDITA